MRLNNVHPRKHKYGKIIYIFTDNEAVILALEAYHTTSELVWECKQLLLRLGSTNNVTLAWVPGHSGVEGNELADELAKKRGEFTAIWPGTNPRDIVQTGPEGCGNLATKSKDQKLARHAKHPQS